MHSYVEVVPVEIRSKMTNKDYQECYCILFFTQIVVILTTTADTVLN